MKSTHLQRWGGILAAAVLLASSALAQSGGSCAATYSVGSTWPGNFQGNLTVSNTGTTAITSWTLTWTYGGNQNISQLWNGALTQTGQSVTVKNLSYNGAVPAGGNTGGIGFNASVTGVNAVPVVSCAPGGTQPPPPGDFSLAASPANLTIPQGGSGTSTIAIGRTGGFASAVNFTATGLPAGVTASFNPAAASGASTVLTFTASSTATAGPATVTVTGTGGGLTHTAAIGLTVTAAADFSLAPVPSSLSVAQGSSGTSTIAIARSGGFAGAVGFTTGVLPPGVTASFNPAAATTGATVLLTLTASSTATPGTASVVVTGSSGSLTHSVAISLTVTSGADFSIAPVPPSLSIPQGSSGTVTVAVGRTGGFAGALTLTLSGLPVGVTTSISPVGAITGSSATVTFTVSAATPVGPAPVTLTATSGTLTHTTAIGLTITPAAGFTISAVPSGVTLPRGGTATSTIAIARTGGFTDAVTLSSSPLPTGVTASFSANPAPGASSVVTFTAAATAAVAPSTVTITGTSGTLTQTATISLSVTGATSVFTQHFIDLWNNIHNPANGYFSPQGVPYHSVETLIVEAPDYGHETVSETYSYWVWLEAMWGNVTGDWTTLQAAWKSLEANMIPGPLDQPTNNFYNPSKPASFAPELDTPSQYPSILNTGVVAGTDPLAGELSSTYGTQNMYAMHWIIDSDNFYGYGQRGDGVSKPSFMNTFQRGPLESVWKTIPQPSFDVLKFGGVNGYLDLFIAPGPYARQWKYTDAPDADARTVQAMFWAKTFADAKGGSPIVDSLLPKASKLGDYLRYAFFDKYFKQLGCTSLNCPAGTGYNAAHFLLSWYFAWGGANPGEPNGGWAWRIGDSSAHFGYQNPLAAFALSSFAPLKPASPNASRDWTTALGRQVEFYRWLQSAEGGIAGGADNGWQGRYNAPPVGDSTFYNMAFDFQPVFHDPPSNKWFGFQTWSMERVAEYYFVTGDPHAKIILDPWINWAVTNTTLNADGSFAIPSDLAWVGQPSLNWNATTQNWTPGDPAFNSGLHVTITSTGQDVGVAGSLAKALSYYSAGTKKFGTQDLASQNLAKELLTRVWAQFRDPIGISSPEVRKDFNQFNTPVFVPPAFSGTMPNGDPINQTATFLSLRSKYKNDPAFPKVQAYLNGGPAPTFTFHRFWAQVDIALAYAVYDQLFPQ